MAISQTQRGYLGIMEKKEGDYILMGYVCELIRANK